MLKSGQEAYALQIQFRELKRHFENQSSALADSESAGGALQGGDSGGGSVGVGGRSGRHPVHEEFALPSSTLLCAGQFRRTKDKTLSHYHKCHKIAEVVTSQNRHFQS